MKQSIRTKLMRTFMLLLCAVVVFSSVLTLLGMRSLRGAVVDSAQQLGNLASRSSYEAIVTQALTAADGYAAEKALTISQALQAYMTAAAEMADFAAYLYEHPDDYRALSVSTPAELVQAGQADVPALQYIPADSSVTSSQAEVERWLLGNLRSEFSTVYANLPGISSIYTAHESGANIGYDANAALKADTPTLDCRTSTWYAAIRSTGETYVSEPYADRFGHGLTVTLAQPIIAGGVFNGVLGVDILIESIRKEIQNTRYGESGYAMLLESDGDVIASGGQDDGVTGFGTDALSAVQAQADGYVAVQIDDQDTYLLSPPFRPSAGS